MIKSTRTLSDLIETNDASNRLDGRFFINPNSFSKGGNRGKILPRGKGDVDIFGEDPVNGLPRKRDDDIIWGMGLTKSIHRKIDSRSASNWIE